MLSLADARKIQKKAEIKTLALFIALTAAIGIISYLVFSLIEFNDDISDYYKLYYLVPFALWGVVIKISGAMRFLQAKEFVGEIIKVEIYRAEERKTKSGGFDALQDKSFEAELMVKNEKGKVIMRVFPNGDTTSRLREGDKVAILRFVNEPVVIEGMYWKKSAQ